MSDWNRGQRDKHQAQQPNRYPTKPTDYQHKRPREQPRIIEQQQEEQARKEREFKEKQEEKQYLTEQSRKAARAGHFAALIDKLDAHLEEENTSEKKSGLFE